MRPDRRQRIALLVAAVVMALTMSFSGVAFAKIAPVDTGCETRGGGEPGGQQPTCKGGGLEQQTESQNPAGNAPKGHNK